MNWWEVLAAIVAILAAWNQLERHRAAISDLHFRLWIAEGTISNLQTRVREMEQTSWRRLAE